MNGYKRYVLLSVPLFAIHVLEEVLTNFYSVDPSTQLVATYLKIAPLEVYICVQVIALLFLLYLFFRQNMPLLVLFGLILLLELDHPVHSLISGSYYSGVVTSIPLIVVGFFFWRDFLKQKMLI